MVIKNEITKDRPIYRVLPSEYSDFASADYLTDSAYLVNYFETIYNTWLASLKTFLDFDGDLSVFIDDQLNALAPYFGFSEEYDPTEYAIETKIKLYRGVYQEPFIWRFRGSEAVFDFVIDAFGLKAKLTRPSAFIAGISKAGDICGATAPGIYRVVVPQSYGTASKEINQVKELVKLWLPFYIKIQGYTNSDLPFNL